MAINKVVEAATPLFVGDGKKTRRVNFSFGRLLRMVGFFTLQGLWPLLRRISWLTVFAVNAGRREDVLAYCPSFLEGWFRKNRPVSPGGWIYTPGHRLSLVVVSPFSNDEILRDAGICRRIARDLMSLRARRVAMNGVIPSAMTQHNLWNEVDQRFVRDQKGTVFMVCDNVREIVARHGTCSSKPVIAVVGAGYTGLPVIRGLVSSGYMVAAVDKRLGAGDNLPNEVAFWGNDYSRLATAGIVILLTGKGDNGIDSVGKYLRPGTIILSDTHPKVSSKKWRPLKESGVIAYESAAVRKGSFFFPALPRFARDSLPGCVVYAFVEALGNATTTSQGEFNALARQVGLTGKLDRPR